MVADTMTAPPPIAVAAAAPVETIEENGGVTVRVWALCLAIAVLLGYVIPIIDVKLSNTFLGAAHLPPGAVAVLLILLLMINPLVRLVGVRPGGTGMMGGVAAVLLVAGAWLLWQSRDNMWGWSALVLGVLAAVGASLGRHPLTRNETLTIYIACLFSPLGQFCHILIEKPVLSHCVW